MLIPLTTKESKRNAILQRKKRDKVIHAKRTEGEGLCASRNRKIKNHKWGESVVPARRAQSPWCL